MTIAELAVTVSVLGVLGLFASRFGLSAIPAYLLAGILLGPNEPKIFTLIEPSEVTDFLAEIGLIFLLFFLGLEFTLGRLASLRRHAVVGGVIDGVLNGALGLIVGIAAFGFSFAAVILGAAIYVSSSAITVKGLIDFRRLADDETDLVLAILVAEDIAIAFVLGFAVEGGGTLETTLAIVGKALLFITVTLAVSKYGTPLLERFLDWLPREFFLLAVVGFVFGAAAAAEELGLSEAIGALMAGVALSETSVRGEIEERFFSFRDVFAALFFFAFGLSIDIAQLDELAWLLALALVVTLVGKVGLGLLAGPAGGFTRRQSFNAGVALIAHGEFTIVLAELASRNPAITADDAALFGAFAGLYVLVSATVGVTLMKESKLIGRRLFQPAAPPALPP